MTLFLFLVSDAEIGREKNPSLDIFTMAYGCTVFGIFKKDNFWKKIEFSEMKLSIST